VTANIAGYISQFSLPQKIPEMKELNGEKFILAKGIRVFS
jgi:hypothetical protein